MISISQLLGHENLNITLKVYAHQLESLKEKSNDKCKKIFEKFGAGITKTPVYQGFFGLFYGSIISVVGKSTVEIMEPFLV